MTLVWCPVCQTPAEVAVDRVAISVLERKRPVKVIEHRWCAGCGSSLESAA